ncbi:1-phosphofructokinase [Leptolyngbya sp. NIES-2104]|uniref:1-phosphofructokinase n=1 Tax=Leptolyngbya sp. NIES-2104 TaxID=1552121 RepID=UPI0006EC9972|nr:1-phosphofructokinase [Leptolyngbya sp. NIES-2104]GAP95166.1 1-phosphofructokinase [Leptolyngbya sp. NIES-2104]
MKTKVATITLNPAIDHTAAIPYFTAGEVNRVTWEQIDPGGKGINVASFLSGFDVPISVSGFLGQHNADLFQRFFAEKQIDNRFVMVDGYTRVNIKIVDEAQDQVTDINFPGLTPTETDLSSFDQVIDSLIKDCDWFILSGSIPTGMSADIYGKLIDRLKRQGKTVVLDASGESLQQAIPFAPYAIKPNVNELQELIGRSLDDDRAIIQAAEDLIHQGIQCVVVSMGAKGAIFVDRSEVIHARPPQVEVISTVGAGDAMVAGFIVGKLQNFSLSDCAKLATTCSIAALSQIGPRLPPRDTIESWMSQVKIKSLLQTHR